MLNHVKRPTKLIIGRFFEIIKSRFQKLALGGASMLAVDNNPLLLLMRHP